MIIIEDKSELKKYLNDDTKTIGAMDIGGIAHNGHHFIFNECKKLVDILIVIFVEWNYSALSFTRSGKFPEIEHNRFSMTIDSLLKSSETIDYLVYSPITDFIKEQTINININKELSYSFCENIGVKSIADMVLISSVYDNDLKDLNYYTGPKNILIDLISRKLFDSSKIYNPTYLWKSLRDKKTFHTISRSSNRLLFGLLLKKVYDHIISNGNIDNKRLIEIRNMVSYEKNVNMAIIDLQTLNKLDQTSNNCVIYCNDIEYFDYLFIKDGNMIWD